MAQTTQVGVLFRLFMKKILCVGYGNFDRQDDGVAWHVLVGLAKKLNLITPIEPGDAFDSGNEAVDLIFDLQLLPEMVETLHEYEQIYFIDAHTGEIEKNIQMIKIHPKLYNSPFTHHLPPEMLLSIHETMYGTYPKAYLVSIRGFEFGFSRILSDKTQKLANQAITMIYDQISADLQLS